MDNLNNTYQILLVEDNHGDILLAQKAYEMSDWSCVLHVAEDGEQAIDFLKEVYRKNSAELPDLVLLDINMPKKNGLEVLEEIKTSDDFKHIPVVMFTSSKAERDVSKCYDLHANGYVLKPVGLRNLIETIQKLNAFWLGTSVSPKTGRS